MLSELSHEGYAKQLFSRLLSDDFRCRHMPAMVAGTPLPKEYVIKDVWFKINGRWHPAKRHVYQSKISWSVFREMSDKPLMFKVSKVKARFGDGSEEMVNIDGCDFLTNSNTTGSISICVTF